MAARVARYQEKSERARDQANFWRDNCFIAQFDHQAWRIEVRFQNWPFYFNSSYNFAVWAGLLGWMHRTKKENSAPGKNL